MARSGKKRPQTLLSDWRLMFAILAGLTLFGLIVQAQNEETPTHTREAVLTLSIPADLASSSNRVIRVPAMD